MSALLQVKSLCVDYVTDSGMARAVNKVSLDIRQARLWVLLANRAAAKVPWRSRSVICTVRRL